MLCVCLPAFQQSNESGELQGDGSINSIEFCKAADNGDKHQLRQLKDRGVDVNIGDCDRRTAMHLAASNGAVS